MDLAQTLESPLTSASVSRDINIVVTNHGTGAAHDVEVVADLVYPGNSSCFFSSEEILPAGRLSLDGLEAGNTRHFRVRAWNTDDPGRRARGRIPSPGCRLPMGERRLSLAGFPWGWPGLIGGPGSCPQE